jgi:hypothetical protein
MNSDPLLDKMDALLKKHRGEAEAPAKQEAPSPEEPASPPPLPDDAWLPVLTDVVAMGEPSSGAPTPEPEMVSAEEVAPASPEPTIDPAVLIEQIMGELEPRLSAMLRDRLAVEIRNSLDDNLSTLLAQMDVHIREIVRESVNEQLGKP